MVWFCICNQVIDGLTLHLQLGLTFYYLALALQSGDWCSWIVDAVIAGLNYTCSQLTIVAMRTLFFPVLLASLITPLCWGP